MLHDALVYVPESVPLVQVLVCETEVQEEPYGTVVCEYAVTDWPLVMVCPLKVQESGVPTVQEVLV
jgi:hypothetical protein